MTTYAAEVDDYTHARAIFYLKQSGSTSWDMVSHALNYFFDGIGVPTTIDRNGNSPSRGMARPKAVFTKADATGAEPPNLPMTQAVMAELARAYPKGLPRSGGRR